MNFADVVIGNTIYAINRPPNNQEDLIEGVVIEKRESSYSQYVVIRIGDPNLIGFSKTYDIPVSDVYLVRADAINALEDIYDDDATEKAAYIASLRA